MYYKESEHKSFNLLCTYKKVISVKLFEHGDEALGSLKRGEFLDKLSDS
jgi:hypothetical protein